MCATTAGQNEFARDVVEDPCRPVPLIATNKDACTRFAEIVSQEEKATEHIAADINSEL